MTNAKVSAREAVIQALAEITGLAPDGIDTGLTVQGLGLVSLDFVRVVQLTEDAAGLRFQDAEVDRLDDFVLLVEQTLGQG